jgi:hypothetical protein
MRAMRSISLSSPNLCLTIHVSSARILWNLKPCLDAPRKFFASLESPLSLSDETQEHDEQDQEKV